MKAGTPKQCDTLTVREERFCEFSAKGDSGTEAYLNAGWKCSRVSAAVNASKLLRKANVKARIAAIRDEATRNSRAKTLLSLEETKEILAEIIRTPPSGITTDSLACQEFVEEVAAGGTRGQLKRGKASRGNETVDPLVLRRKIKGVDRLRAIEIYSKLSNFYKDEEAPVTLAAGIITLETIKELAVSMKIVSPLLLHRMASASQPATARN